MSSTNSDDEQDFPQNSGKCGEILRITVCANQGGRKYMEDRVHVQHVRPEDGSEGYTYVAVYDGHGGADASEFVRKHLLKNIQKQEGFNGSDEEMLEAIRKGFIATHYSMWNVVDEWPLTASGYTSTAGTTASVAFVSRGRLFIGHVGDSAIILGRKKAAAGEVFGTSLTKDHKPDNSDEEARINRAGGMVMRKSGVMRVVWTRPLKGYSGSLRVTPTESIAFLAVARSLGDLWSYNKETKQFVVSPEPDVAVHSLTTEDFCLVIGSDGLTNVLRPQQIAEVVDKCEKDSDIAGGKLVNHSRVLLRHALQGWGNLRADNITVLTLLFDQSDENEIFDPFFERFSQCSASNMVLEEVFTENQTMLVRVTPDHFQQLPTVKHDIVYTGALDHQFTSEIDYRGPGFSKQIVKDNPIAPPKSSCLRRSLSYAAMSSDGKDNGEPYYCLIDFCNATWQSSSGDSANSTNDDEAEPCSSNQHLTSEEIPEEDVSANSKFRAGGSFFRILRTEEEKEEEKNIQKTSNDHAYASPSSKPIAVVPPFETTPVSSGRKRLIPLRRGRTSTFRQRGAARRNLLMDEESLLLDNESEEFDVCRNGEDAGLKESDCLGDKVSIDKNVAGKPESSVSSARQSFGGSSALSPMLMLAALRTPDQLMLRQGANDPLRRELTTFRYSRYYSFVLSPTTSKLGELKIGEASNSHRRESHAEIPSSAQKRKAGLDGSAKTSEPPPKRSRIWGFFTSLLGDRKSK